MKPQNEGVLKVQARVLGALLMREIVIRYGRYNIGFLWIIIEPMLFTLIVTVLWGIMSTTQSSKLPITAFTLTGYSSVLLWRNCVNRSVLAVQVNRNLLHHHYVKVPHMYLARCLLEISSATVSFFVLTITFSLFGLMELPNDVFLSLMGWLFQAWFGAALALIVGSLSEFANVVERIWQTLSYILFPISGAGFMVDWLPKQFQELVLWLPMVNGLEMMREGFFGENIHAHYSVSYLIFSCSLLTLIGLYLTEWVIDHME